MSEYCLIITTASSAKEADKISKILLEEKLAACIQQTDIKSSYHWQGKIEKSSEVLMFIKTRRELYPKIEKAIKDNHSYQTPEIIKLPITDGLPAYLSWIAAETRD